MVPKKEFARAKQEDAGEEIASLRAENSRVTKRYEEALREMGTQRSGTEKSPEDQTEISAMRAECGRPSRACGKMQSWRDTEQSRRSEPNREARERRLVR